MTIAISIDKTLETIYAFVALEARGEADGYIVGKDEAPALRVIARQVLGDITARFGSLISSSDFESDPDIVSIVLDLDNNALVAPVVSSLLASALCTGILAEISKSRPEISDRYASIHESELRLLTARIARSSRIRRYPQ